MDALATQIATDLSLKPTQVDAAIRLMDEGNTLPFIARYRKEMTGSLDDEQLRQIADLLKKYRALEERRTFILATIEEQGKLTDDLRSQINTATTLTELEDLYQPYKPKRRTRAQIAREKGLEPLAQQILEQKRGQSPEALAKAFLNADVETVEDALAGARDIVAETISDDAGVRGEVREKAMRFGLVQSGQAKNADDPKGVYRDYYDFEFRVGRIKPHQVLAINRGENEKVLRVKIDVAERDWRNAITYRYRVDARSPLAPHLEQAIDDAASRLLLPAIERDVRRALTDEAERHAIKVFADNLRALLNQPPLADHIILGIDPGFRTGCKVAVIDPTGRVLDTATIYPHEPQRQWDAAKTTINRLMQAHAVTLIAIGNGTASRESEQLAAEITRDRDDVHYLIVNEAGASVYSASKLARAELPDLDVTLRGAVSIARRVQDPLAEQVKIDPKSIGVGMYQHDVDQSALNDTLAGVVESVVNHVGVDVNTASPALLTHIAGIGPKLADSIVAYRDENGVFRSRKQLKDVSGLGPKSFEQSAGFLRVRESDDPLDASAIHPESYTIARKLIKRAKLDMSAPPEEREAALEPLREDIAALADELGAGIPTLTDILAQLVRPGRDPREDLPQPLLRNDVLTMNDLLRGMQLSGTVRNVVDFGAFVDIGVKQDGLLHISKIPRGTQLSVGDVIEVQILDVDQDRGRISLGWVE